MKVVDKTLLEWFGSDNDDDDDDDWIDDITPKQCERLLGKSKFAQMKKIARESAVEQLDDWPNAKIPKKYKNDIEVYDARIIVDDQVLLIPCGLPLEDNEHESNVIIEVELKFGRWHAEDEGVNG